MITIRDGDVYQWDSGRQIEVDSDVCEVHFASCNSKDAYVTVPVDGVCNIPNILLQSGEDFVIYAVCQKEEREQTVEHLRVWVKGRAKPSDYVYTETEVFDYKALEERIKQLEDNGGSSGGTGVSDVLVNGTSIVADGVANIPMATKSTLGIIGVNASMGIDISNVNGTVYISKATNEQIDARTNDYKPIVPKKLDYAIKCAMTDGKGPEWTSEEKASARDRLGLGWSLIDTMDVSDVSQVEITFPQEYDEFMIIADISGTGSSVVYPSGAYFLNQGTIQARAFLHSDYYPGDKDEHYELIFEKMVVNGDTYFRLSGFEKTDFMPCKLKQNLQSTGWSIHYDVTNTLQCHVWYNVKFARTITNATFKIYGR